MAQVLLTKTFEFSSAHRYFRPEWSDEENYRAFKEASRSHGHGHNYTLEVTLAGQVDGQTGMVINLTDVKAVVQRVLEQLDHKNLNKDVPYFVGRVPTTENVAVVLWELLDGKFPQGKLYRVLLREDEDLYVERYGDQ